MSANSHINKHHTSYEVRESITKEQFLEWDDRRRMVRYVVATLSAIVAVVYFLIGFNFITVFEMPDTQLFGLFAGVAYAFGALMLLTLRDRTLWIIGAVLQVFVIYTYFSLAQQRVPEFEVWGLMLQLLQILIFVGLMYLIARAPKKNSGATFYDWSDFK